MVRPNEIIATFLILLVIILIRSQQNAQLFVLRMLYEMWMNHYGIIATTALLRARNRRLRRQRRAPYAWTLPRPIHSWFELYYNDRTLPDVYFKEQLRLSRNTFDLVKNLLAPRLTRQDSRLREAIPAEKVLALGLYRLAHGNSYKTIAPTFNVGKTTVIEAVQDLVGALYEIRNEHIKFPETADETLAIMRTFEDLTDLPNVAGAIDGSHVRIKAPVENAVDYFSRYQQHDMIIQAVVDGNKIFLDFACGFPGSMHDAPVLRRSTLFTRAEQNNILTAPTKNVNGTILRPYLLGDSAYPLSPWLMKPYPEGTRDPDEINFNKELSSGRVKVECAFGILKSRWRILQKRLDSDIDFTIKCAIACAVLHNICLRNGDDWDDYENEEDQNPANNNAANVIRDGDDMREILKDYIA